MSRFAPMPYRAARRVTAPALVSASRFRWQARRGTLDALSGQTGTLTRASTGTAVDVTGATYTAGHSMPRWENRDFSGTGARYELGLRLVTDDLTFPVNWLPETGTLLIQFSEEGTRTTSGAGLVYIGNDAVTGARLLVYGSANNYRADIHNGTSIQAVSLANTAPLTGQSASLVVQLEDTGTTQRVRMTMRTGGTDVTTAWSGTVSRAAAWGADAKLRLNRVGSAGTQGSTWVRQVAWCPGLLTIDEMAARL